MLGCRGDAVPPDVVIVTWDTVRADHVGTARLQSGEPDLPPSATPVWDAFSRDGVVFAEARSPVAITLPAHASLLTGTFPLRHGVRDNGAFRLGPELPTLAERFRAAGYATGAFVSAAVLDRRYGLARGFEVYDDALGTQTGPRTVAARRGDATVASAVAWLDRVRPDRPVFLWVHLYDPHRLWQAPEPWASRLPPYRAEIAFADHQTGRLLRAFQERRSGADEIVVLTSDHGEGLGEHGESTHSFFAYDSTLRVPLLVWVGDEVAGARRPGAVVRGPASLVDVAATVTELAGIALPPGDGRSLVAQLTGEPVPPREHPLESVVPALDYGAAPVFGVLTATGETWFDVPRRERYDLARDPGQRRNLYREERDGTRADALFARWAWAWPPEGGLLAPDPETRAQLESLGYVTDTAAAAEGSGEAIDPKDRAALFEFLSLGAESLGTEAALARSEALQRRLGPVRALGRFRIDALQDLGRSRDALLELEALVRRHPDDPGLREELSQREAIREAQRELASAIRRTWSAEPDHPTAQRDLALTLHRLQEWEEAERLYRGWLGRRPEDAEVRSNLARLLVARGTYAEALDLVEAGRGERGSDPALDCLAGRILADHLSRAPEAVGPLRACVDAGGPMSSRSRAVLARARPRVGTGSRDGRSD